MGPSLKVTAGSRRPDRGELVGPRQLVGNAQLSSAQKALITSWRKHYRGLIESLSLKGRLLVAMCWQLRWQEGARDRWVVLPGCDVATWGRPLLPDSRSHRSQKCPPFGGGMPGMFMHILSTVHSTQLPVAVCRAKRAQPNPCVCHPEQSGKFLLAP